MSPGRPAIISVRWLTSGKTTHSLDIELAKLLPTHYLGGSDGEQGIIDVSVTPVDTLDF
jgi:hypothetical protein